MAEALTEVEFVDHIPPAVVIAAILIGVAIGAAVVFLFTESTDA
jgi:multisubunit Na+/H+ antiporter MnhC subunit